MTYYHESDNGQFSFLPELELDLHTGCSLGTLELLSDIDSSSPVAKMIRDQMIADQSKLR
jgi:hypothetical protein